jgi:hypothetical protein
MVFMIAGVLPFEGTVTVRPCTRRFSEGGTMSLQARIDSLKGRHANLDLRIVAEDQRPRPDSQELSKLKLEKLRIKEEMERLRQH